MSYTDSLWIKITNSYSNWSPLACTQSLRYCDHSSIELSNISTGKSAAAFRRDRFEISMLGCLFLQHPLPWTELELPAGFSPSTQGMDNPAVAGNKCSRLTSDWPSASPDLNPLGYKSWSKFQEMACKKRYPNIEHLKRSLQKAAADFPVDMFHNSIDEWPQRLRDGVHANCGHFE